MAFQKVVDTVAITVVWLQNVESLTTIFHAELPGGYTQVQVEGLADAVDVLIDAEMLPIMSVDASYVRTEVRGLAEENDKFAENNDRAGPGLDTGAGLPNNVTLSVKKGSGLTGRSARGRWYVVGLSRDKLAANENQFTTSSVAGTVAAVEAVRAGIETAGWDPVIVSRFTAGAERSEGKTFPWLSTSAVNENVDTQRRRLTA